jgi:hypothetical protein
MSCRARRGGGGRGVGGGGGGGGGRGGPWERSALNSFSFIRGVTSAAGTTPSCWLRAPAAGSSPGRLQVFSSSSRDRYDDERSLRCAPGSPVRT